MSTLAHDVVSTQTDVFEYALKDYLRIVTAARVRSLCLLFLFLHSTVLFGASVALPLLLSSFPQLNQLLSDPLPHSSSPLPQEILDYREKTMHKWQVAAYEVKSAQDKVEATKNTASAATAASELDA